MKISDLDFYALFILKDINNKKKRIATTDLTYLKNYTKSDFFAVGGKISFYNNIYTITDICISNIDDKIKKDFKDYKLNGEIKDYLLTVTILLEQQPA